MTRERSSHGEETAVMMGQKRQTCAVRLKCVYGKDGNVVVSLALGWLHCDIESLASFLAGAETRVKCPIGRRRDRSERGETACADTLTATSRRKQHDVGVDSGGEMADGKRGTLICRG
jgi:hypothetical protein